MPVAIEDDQLVLPAIGHDRFIRYNELRTLGISYSRQHLRLLEDGGHFPKRYQLSDRVIAWKLSELREWMATRRGRS